MVRDDGSRSRLGRLLVSPDDRLRVTASALRSLDQAMMEPAGSRSTSMVGSPALSAATARAMASVVFPALASLMREMVNIGQGPGEVWSWCARGRDRRRGRGLVRQPFLGPGHVTTVQVGDRGPTQAWACARLFGGRVGVTAARWVADVPHAGWAASVRCGTNSDALAASHSCGRLAPQERFRSTGYRSPQLVATVRSRPPKRVESGDRRPAQVCPPLLESHARTVPKTAVRASLVLLDSVLARKVHGHGSPPSPTSNR